MLAIILSCIIEFQDYNKILFQFNKILITKNLNNQMTKNLKNIKIQKKLFIKKFRILFYFFFNKITSIINILYPLI